jgi:serine/alanine adding enzyme
MVALAPPSLSIRAHAGRAIADALPRLREYATRGERVPLTRDPGWLNVLANGFGHTPYALEAVEAGRTVGYLPLAFVRSLLFGKFLVSLPYLNSNGVQADTPTIATALVDEAVRLADNLRVRHLELRQESPVVHLAFNAEMRSKVHMRLRLPDTTAALSKAIGPKVRNQIRKGEKSNLTVEWGGEGLVEAFHEVFSRNMRDLGTPVYGQKLLVAVLKEYSSQSEICVVRHKGQPIAAALLLHGVGVTEVPSASCLREFNSTCANMLMYWHLLERAIQRGQQVFDFGRSTVDGSTYKFKQQWGAKPEPAVWQYYARRGSPSEMRPDNPKYQRLIRIWQRLPVSVTRWIGPKIARGIP